MTTPQVIEVEIAPTCNLRCPHCNVAARLHVSDKERRFDPLLEEKIIKYVPKNCELVFVGLGEPTLPLSQKRIAKILQSRSDLKGFIQTNGTFPLSEELVALVKNKQLTVGLSYDTHHERGGRKSVNIQPELVCGLSIAVDGNDEWISHLIASVQEKFINVNRILVDPYFSEDTKETHATYEEVERVAVSLVKELPHVDIYIGLFTSFLEKNDSLVKYYYEGMKDLAHVKDDWFLSKKGFYVLCKDTKKHPEMRILIDGRIAVEASNIVSLSWKELENYSDKIFLLEEFFLQKV